jgi:hypothetical protein
MTPKILSFYAALCISNLGSVYSFAVTSTFESSLSGVNPCPNQHKKATSSTLFYDVKSDDANAGESPLWLPSSGTTPEDRLLKMKEYTNRFAQAKEELEELRSDMKQMKDNLALSLVTDDLMRIVALTKSIKEAQEKDPEFVYSRALEKIASAGESGKYTTRKKYDLITHYTKEAKVAREFIPRLNMHGLWVAK